MCQYLVVEYMATHQKFVPVSSRPVHEVTSEIYQYLVVEYMMTHIFDVSLFTLKLNTATFSEVYPYTVQLDISKYF
jgi:hypothetical protein